MELKRVAGKLGNAAYVSLPKEFIGKELTISDEVKHITLDEIEDAIRRVIREELEKVKT